MSLEEMLAGVLETDDEDKSFSSFEESDEEIRDFNDANGEE